MGHVERAHGLALPGGRIRLGPGHRGGPHVGLAQALAAVSGAEDQRGRGTLLGVLDAGWGDHSLLLRVRLQDGGGGASKTER